jgi:hypothetical protein
VIAVVIAAGGVAVWFLVLVHAGGAFHAGVHRTYRARHTEADAPAAGTARRRAVGIAPVVVHPSPRSHNPIGAS